MTAARQSAKLDTYRVRIIRLKVLAQAVACGLVSAAVLFFATIWLVLKGGDAVGPHLGLLGQYFIGYRVSFLGAWIGALYAFAVGFFGGGLVAWIYNALVEMRKRS